MSKSWEWVWVNPNEAVRRISELERENAELLRKNLEWESERVQFANRSKKLHRLEEENARLQMELDASWNAEELRKVRAELAALQEVSQKNIL